MRVLSFHILLMAVLVAAVTGCGGAHRYDGRLMAADSLMHDNLDSALAIIQAVCPDSLTTEGDRAYRDLLLTQARYKCYIVATSDSDINRALAYYRQHKGEREKLTRAYIYKGAVMDELGHPDSAMFYYKHAEATAAPDDYFNLGYSKLRIAALYKDQFSQDSCAIDYWKDAIRYFEILRDSSFLISCYGDLGAACGTQYPDSTEFFLNHAITIAQSFKPSKQYTYKSKLAGFYFYYNHDYQRAKELAMDVFRNGKDYSLDPQFYYYAAWSYIRLGHLDSAKYVFNATPAPKDAVDSMNKHQLLAEIAKAENNIIAFGENMTRSKDNKIQILTNRKNSQLKIAESDYNRIRAEYQKAETAHNNHNLLIVLCAIGGLTILMLCLIVHMKSVIKRNGQEKEAIEQILIDKVAELEEKQSRLTQIQDSVSQLFAYRIDALNELYDSIKFRSKMNSNNRMRSIIPLSSVIMGLSDTYHTMNVELTDSFWDKMKCSVDGEYKGIISYVEKKYPNLTDKEKELFCLVCANVSPQVIKLCMNYNNVRSVSNRVNIIIKKKMGLNMTLEEFIDKHMKGLL